MWTVLEFLGNTVAMLESVQIGIKNMFEENMSSVVALEYLMELYKVHKCGRRKLEYCRAQITELK